MAFQVLMVDDDTSFQKLMEMRLKSFIPDMHFTTFNNLGEARKHLKEVSPSQLDLVILDEHLPDGHGIDLLEEQWFEGLAVLSISSDDAPEIPGKALRAGAAYFLNKVHVSQPLFKPLVQGVIDRNKLQRELSSLKVKSAVMDSVKTLISTLQHEINNPLGAVLGGAYLLQNSKLGPSEQKEAATLVEASGNRIKHVLEQLCKAVELEPVTKANQKVFHIPGDKPWNEG